MHAKKRGLMENNDLDERPRTLTRIKTPEIKKAWVTALRSGEFKQGKGQLHNRETDTYCCLGVLCEIAVKSGVNVKQEWMGDCKMFDGHFGTLPPAIREWSGLEQGGARVWIHDRPLMLTDQNDNYATFEEIADAIEEQL